MKLFLPIQEDKNLCSNHIFFQYIQTFLAVIILAEHDILLQQFFHQPGDLGIAFDKISVIDLKLI